jgi:hypothetical protein
VPALAKDGSQHEAGALPDWVKKRGKGVRDMTNGAILLAIVALMGAVFLALAPANMTGLMIWLAFFGWMAIPGGISLAQGLGAIFEARVLSRGGALTTEQLPAPAAARLANPSGAALISEAPPSVTEHTTRKFNTNESAKE